MTRWTAADIPNQAGKTAVVTGANSGIGFHTALELARAGARVVLAVRDEVKGNAAIRRLQAEVPDADLHLDLLDLADPGSVHRFAVQVLDTTGPPDLLVNSAGVMGVPQRLTTRDGFELHFDTNHLGHFALAGLLLPGLLTRPGARVVTVSSLAHEHGQIRFDDLQCERSYRPWSAYSQSKLANLLFAFELDRQARASGLDLISVAVHPGVSATNLQTAGPRLGHQGFLMPCRLFFVRRIGQSAAYGALPSLYAATAPEVVGGGFYGPDGPGQLRGNPTRVLPASGALDEQMAQRLWEVSERLTGIRFQWMDPSADIPDRAPHAPEDALDAGRPS
jgi:NAD(P)-dependent dehydrogenase (short-subunit alcohol dehydrogenase family)